MTGNRVDRRSNTTSQSPALRSGTVAGLVAALSSGAILVMMPLITIIPGGRAAGATACPSTSPAATPTSTAAPTLSVTPTPSATATCPDQTGSPTPSPPSTQTPPPTQTPSTPTPSTPTPSGGATPTTSPTTSSS